MVRYLAPFVFLSFSFPAPAQGEKTPASAPVQESTAPTASETMHILNSAIPSRNPSKTSKPQLDASVISRLSPEIVAKLLLKENHKNLKGPARILESALPAESEKDPVVSLLAGSAIVLINESVDNVVAKKRRFDVDAGSEVFIGDVIHSGIIINTGKTAVALQDFSGNTVVVDPGGLVTIQACTSSCNVVCGGGPYSCCWTDVNGCARCVCMGGVGDGPEPEQGCSAGGPGSIACGIAEN